MLIFRTYLCHKDPFDVNVSLKILIIISCQIFDGQLTWWNLNCSNLKLIRKKKTMLKQPEVASFLAAKWKKRKSVFYVK